MDANEKRKVILENYSHPYNMGIEETDGYIKTNSNNISCIDNIDLYVKIENDIIKDVRFTGEACAVAISSTSIMLKEIIGKSIDDVLAYTSQFKNMVDDEPYDSNILNNANVFDSVVRTGNRKVCAYLPYNALLEAIDIYKGVDLKEKKG